MADEKILPIAPRVRDATAQMLDRILVDGVDVRWKVRQLVRFAYAAGYEDGHYDGGREERDDARAEKAMEEKVENGG